MLERLLKEQTDDTLIQLFRYSFTGSIAILIDFYFLFIFTDMFKIHYLASAAMAYMVGIAVNYYLSTIWVFSKRVLDNSWLEFALFTFIGIVGMGFLELFMWAFTDMIHFHYLYSKVLATVLVSLWNFFARKYIIFS